jgi:hypothetical protein
MDYYVGDTPLSFIKTRYINGSDFTFSSASPDCSGKVVLLSFINIRSADDWEWMKRLVDINTDYSAEPSVEIVAVIYNLNDAVENSHSGPVTDSWITEKRTAYGISYNPMQTKFAWLREDDAYSGSIAKDYRDSFSGPTFCLTFIINKNFMIMDKWSQNSGDSGDGNVSPDGNLNTNDLIDFSSWSKTHDNFKLLVEKRIDDLLNSEPYIIDVDPADGEEISPGGSITVTFSGRQGAVYNSKKPLSAWDKNSYKLEDASTHIDSVNGGPYVKYKASDYVADTKETRVINLGNLTGLSEGQEVAFTVDSNLRDTNEVSFQLDGAYTYTVAFPKPDLYMRDNLSDDGDVPSAGGLAQSPDIFVLQTQYSQSQAQANYGADSPNENVIPPATVDGTQNNYVYVRVKNQGTVDANDVNVTVYFADGSTLPRPDEWTKVNDADPTVTITAVPSGEELTCSQGVEWTNYPYTGHYCFIGAVDHPEDEAPSLDGVVTTGFSDFIRLNNNITWRNFNVVSNDPPPPPPDAPSGFVILPFMFHGAERKKRMQLEIVERLPIGSRSMMEVPIDILQFIKGRERTPFKVDPKHKVAWLKLYTSGKNLTPEVALPEKYKARLRLFVDIPKQFRSRKHSVYVRQLYKKKEIGRISWLLVPKKYKPWPGFKEPVVKKPVRKTRKPSGRKK